MGIFFFLLGGMFQPCPPKEIQAIFKKDIHYLEVWVLVSHFSEKVSLIQELLPEIGLKNNTLSFIPCMCLFKIAFLCSPENWLQSLDQTWFISQTLQVPQEVAPSQCRSFNKSQVQSYWVHPYASYLGSQDGSLPPAPHPSRKKSREEGDICQYEKSKIFASNPQWISTNIS